MIFEEQSGLEEKYLEDMKASRKKPAVLKTKLVDLRSELPLVPIFAFEGIDDKTIYFHWISRIDNDICYEPFVCDGKDNVLALRKILDKDLYNLKDNVYFFVDRDFDDLRGEQPSACLFMTDAYSVENYLVCQVVLEELLKNEFHCEGQPLVRKEIIDTFSELYNQFLVITKPVNERLFSLRKLKSELKNKLPDKISSLAKISIKNVEVCDAVLEDLISPKEYLSEVTICNAKIGFENLEMASRYRGKFAFLFFKKWLELLSKDKNDGNLHTFSWPSSTSKVKYDKIGLDSLASKSPLPKDLRSFINGISLSIKQHSSNLH